MGSLMHLFFFGFLRSGEATVPTQSSYDAAVHLSISDVSLTSAADPEAIVVRIKASKTDPFRNGTSIFTSEEREGTSALWQRSSVTSRIGGCHRGPYSALRAANL